MESKRELYKQRSRNGLGNRESRARLKEKESKSGRDALLLSKRRIPLSAVQEESQKKKEKGAKLTEAQKSEARLQKLLEWKKMREDARKKEKVNKAKPFVAGASRSATTTAKPQLSYVFAPSAGKGVSFGGAKGAEKAGKSERSAVTKPSKTVTGAVPECPASQPHAAGKRRAASKPKPVGPVKPVASTTKPAPGTSKATHSTGSSSAERGRGANKTKPTPPVTRASKRLAEQNAKKPAPRGRQANGSTLTKGAKVAKETGTARVTRSSAKKVQLKKTPVAPSPPPPTSTRSKGKKRKTVVAAKLAYSSSSSDSDTTSPPVPLPSSPPSSPPHTPLPVPVSMVTQRGTHSVNPFPPTVSGVYSTDPFPPPPPVSDPTWILGAGTDMFQNRTPRPSNFDDVFGGEKVFSPFIFTAGSRPCSASKLKATPKKPFAFTFKKAVNVTPLPLRTETTCSDITSDNMSVDSLNCDSVSVSRATDTMYTPRADRPIRSLGNLGVEAWNGVEGVRVGGDDGKGEEEEVKSEGEGGEEESVAVAPVAEDEVEEEEEKREDIDIGYFRKLHSDVTDILTRKCEEWTDKSQTIEQELQKEEEEGEVDRKTLEEVVDQIRTTVCQAQLLMRKKMKQYLGLVDSAEKGEKMFAEDLQGFWDMMYFQVEDLYKRFGSLRELEQNNWQQPQQTGNRTKRGKGKKRATKSKAASSSQSEKQAAARERREAMRAQLREMKMAAAKRAREDQAEEGGGEEEKEREEEKEKEGVEDCVPETLSQPSPKKPRDEPLVDHTPCQPTTPPNKCGSRGNRRRSSARSRRRSRMVRRESTALIDFSHSLSGDDNLLSSQTDASPNPSGFSPPQQSSAEEVPSSVEVPTADLLNFDPAPVPPTLPMKSPLKWTPRAISRMAPSKKKTPEGASVRRYIAITPSKRVRELLDADLIMSPARRSLRIAGRASRTAEKPPGHYEVSSLLDLPDELEVAYCPNKALL